MKQHVHVNKLLDSGESLPKDSKKMLQRYEVLPEEYEIERIITAKYFPKEVRISMIFMITFMTFRQFSPISQCKHTLTCLFIIHFHPTVLKRLRSIMALMLLQRQRYMCVHLIFVANVGNIYFSSLFLFCFPKWKLKPIKPFRIS